MAEAKPSLGRGVLAPTAVAGAAFGVLGLFLSNFLGDRVALAVGLVAGWVAYAAGRAAGHLDLPRGHGALARPILTGTGVGFAGFAFLNAILVDGPGWPLTPWWPVLIGLGIGVQRAHAPLLKARPGRALALLAIGYAIAGVAGFLLLRAFRGLLPGELAALLLALYGLHGVRLLLRFAAEERVPAGKGFVRWMKANALQNGIVALLLVGYAVFRDELARGLPFHALLEYGLGIALFAFVLARLRARVQREGTPLPTASEARDHARVVAELREAEHDEVARPLTRFIESGQGAREYESVVLASLPPEDERRASVGEVLATHREPPRTPPLELRYGLLAGGALALGLGIAGFAVGSRLFRVEMPFPLVPALFLLGFAVYAQQDLARAHHRPLLAMGIAGAGAGILLLDFLVFAAGIGEIGDVPRVVWGIVAAVLAVLLAAPAVALWRLHRRLAEGKLADARTQTPAMEHAAETQKARRRAATMMIAAFVMLLPVPWLANWLAEAGIVPRGFPPFLRDALAAALWGVLGVGAAALIRFYGLTRTRAQLLAREQEKRARRLALHRRLMQTLERTTP